MFKRIASTLIALLIPVAVFAGTVNGTLDVFGTTIHRKNISGYSGANFSLFSDTGSTLKFKVDGSTGQIQIPSTVELILSGSSVSKTAIREDSVGVFTTKVGGTDRLSINSTGIGIPSGNKFYLDGILLTGNTYWYESAADIARLVVGGTDAIVADHAANIVIFSSRNVALATGRSLYFDGGTNTSTIYTSGNLDTYVGGTLAFRLDASAHPFFPAARTASGTPAYIAAGGELVSTSSSIRYKENVKDLKVDTSNLYKIRPVTFQYKKTHEKSFGMIAEEVDKLFPMLVYHNPDGSAESIDYARLAVLMLPEMKKLKSENAELASRLTKLEAKLSDYSAH